MKVYAFKEMKARSLRCGKGTSAFMPSCHYLTTTTTTTTTTFKGLSFRAFGSKLGVRVCFKALVGFVSRQNPKLDNFP